MAAITCYLYNAKTWGAALGGNTFFILVSGYIMFIISDFFLFKYVKRQYEGVTIIDKGIECIDIRPEIIYVINGILILIGILYFRENIRLAHRLGYSGGYSSELIRLVRSAGMYGLLYTEDKMGTFYTQSVKLITACAYIFLFIFVNNTIYTGNVKKGIKDNKRYLLAPILFCIIQIGVIGSRIYVIRFFLAGIVYCYVLFCRNKKSIYGFSIKQYIRVIEVFLLIIILFKLVTPIIGRGIQASIIEYVTSYIGGGIQMFDKFFLNDGPVYRSDFWGKETFYYFWDFIRKLGFVNFDGGIQLEFHRIGILNDNVYTGYRRSLKDFGMIGMYIMHLIMILFYSVLYHLKLKKSLLYSSNSEYAGYTLVYGYSFYALAFHSFDNFFYHQISLESLVTVFFMWLLYQFCIKRKVVIRWGKV